MTTTVQQLREEGYTVKVRHTRRWESVGEPSFHNDAPVEPFFTASARLAPKGGKTEVRIEKDNSGASGEAVCSLDDNYCRATGRNIALGRALKELGA